MRGFDSSAGVERLNRRAVAGVDAVFTCADAAELPYEDGASTLWSASVRCTT